MEHLDFTLILFCGALFAGIVGALSGLGGGIIIVPFLVLLFDVDTQYAIGASLVGVIATSVGAQVAVLKKGFTNVRLGMLMETATCIGAIFGALLALMTKDAILHIAFGLILLGTTVLSYTTKENILTKEDKEDTLSHFFKLDSSYPEGNSKVVYRVTQIPLGWLSMLVNGVISGLLGIGSGAMMVLVMEKVMRLPLKVSTATSNYIIGVTACASAGTFFHSGYISPPLVLPLIPGVLLGSFIGAKILIKANAEKLKGFFSILVLLIAVQMIIKGVMQI